MPSDRPTAGPSAKQRVVLDAYVDLGCNAARVGRETNHSEVSARRLATRFPHYVRRRQREIDRERRAFERDLEERTRIAQAKRDAWVDKVESEVLAVLKELLASDDPRVQMSAAKTIMGLRSKVPAARSSAALDPGLESILDELLEEVG